MRNVYCISYLILSVRGEGLEKRDGSRGKPNAEGLAKVEGGGVRGQSEDEDRRGGVGEWRQRGGRWRQGGLSRGQQVMRQVEDDGACAVLPPAFRSRAWTPQPLAPTLSFPLVAVIFFFVRFLPFFPEPSTKILRHFRSAQA